ncbi:hypothetical protein Celaphus_00010231 [Cervus elaphus hippelaphus]|uniref:Uncharacterized protein n=1 Tax=Cervus elaphus hippelaphus TaxID=46360 RepID=A0A212C9I0_CEREH|nr:hypothetical protein Celaphus_00010231 [Cervus elaphus hippelaphus]
MPSHRSFLSSKSQREIWCHLLMCAGQPAQLQIPRGHVFFKRRSLKGITANGSVALRAFNYEPPPRQNHENREVQTFVFTLRTLMKLPRPSGAELHGLDVDSLATELTQVNKAPKMQRRAYRAHGWINLATLKWSLLKKITIAMPMKKHHTFTPS